MITPNSKIILLKTPIEIDENNQLTFSNTTSQYNYFHGLPKIELDDATFIRKDNVIRFPTDEEQNGITYDDLLKYNYCMYQNTSYGNKWFYAFIINVEYISNGTTNITIKTDVYQTWCFNITWKKSFILREHIAKSNDVIGANTQPENLETGDYISTKLQPVNHSYNEVCYCVATTKKWLSYYSISQQDIPTGCYYQAFDTIQGVEDFIDLVDNQGGAESINSVFVCPKAFFSSWGSVSGIAGNTSSSVIFNLTSTTLEITHVNYIGNDY